MSRDESLPPVSREPMDFSLGPDAAASVRKMAVEWGYSPPELVKLGLQLAALMHDARGKGHRLAVVNEEGVRINEVVLPEPKRIDETVRKILEQARPSSSLDRSIADLDPERPGTQGQTGHAR